MKKSIVFMGIKHSGKSTIASRLAESLNLRFVDLDTLIESTYRADRLLGCREIYLRHGKEFFTELETVATRRLVEILQSEPVVAALGGGTGENQEAMALLAGRATCIYLEESESVLFERIMRRGRPAFLPEENPREAFHELYERRHRLYLHYADIIAETGGMELDATFTYIRSLIQETTDGR